MLSEAQLSSLLNSAARAQASSATPGSSLIPYLCQAVVNQLSLKNLQLWQVDPNQVLPLWKFREDQDSFTIDEQSLINIEVGEIQEFELPILEGQNFDERLSLTSVVIVDSARLTIGFQHPSAQPVGEDLFQIGEILADIRRRELLQNLYLTYQKQNRVINHLSELHHATSQDELFQLFATDGITVSEFDRISVLSRKLPSGWSIDACTGVESVSVRSEEVQRICSDVNEAEKKNDLSGTILPLSPGGEWNTSNHAVFFEKEGEVGPADLQTARMLSQQLAMALAHVDERNNAKRKHRTKRHLSQSMMWIAVTCFSCLFALLFWRTDFRVKATGQVVPEIRQEVFAPEHGVIQEVNVEHAQFVKKDEVLFEIYNDEILVLREATREELVSAEARYAALQTVSQRNGPSIAPSNSLPTSVELAELGKKIESLKSQVALIDKQVDALKVVAPFDGQVFRERMQEELLGRPVQQGQYVMQIAALEGPWELRLRIPESEIRHVTQVQQNQKEPVRITFALETSPEVERSGVLTHLAKTTDLDSFGELSVLAVSQFNKEEIPDVRFGAGVFSKIHCGRRSLGYLMTRRVSEFWSKYSPF